MTYMYYVDENGKVSMKKTSTTKKKKKQQEQVHYTVDDNGKVTMNNIEDIAPVKQTTSKEKNKKWYEGYLQLGDALKDGYQFGDITKSYTATTSDLTENLTAGIVGMGEKIVDAGAYVAGGVGGLIGADDFKKKTEKFIEKDLYDEKKVAEKLVSIGVNPLNTAQPLIWADRILNDKKEDNSLLGDKTDSLVQSGGQLLATTGLQMVGVPWYLTTGVTSFGGQAETAFKEGATYKQAGGSALISAGAEILFEKLGGGIKFGGKTLDDVLVRPLTEKISNKLLKTTVNLGLDATGEGMEEVFTSVANRLGTSLYKEESIDELLTSEEAMDEYIESFVGGALMGGVAGTGRTITNKRTKSEQSLIDSLVEEQTAQKTKEKAIEDNVKKLIKEREEAQGGVLSEKNKQALRKTVMDKIDSGEIDISSSKLSNKEISAITKEIEQSLEDGTYELSKIEDVLTSEQTKQIKELEEKLKTTKDKTEISNMQKQLSELKNAKLSELQSMTKNNRYLNNAIYEKQQSQKAYEYDDANVTDEYEKATRESAKTHLNNSKESRKLVDIMSKLAKDRQINYRFTNQQELKEQGDLIEDQNLTAEEKTKINNLEKQLKDATTKEDKQYIQNQIDSIKCYDIGGFVRKNSDGVETVIINAESSQSINSVVGHETKHLLEKNKDLNKEFDKLLFEYAKSKGDYDVIRKRIERIYEGIDNVNIDSELSAELTGRYLFTDDKFIESLINDNKNPKKQTIVQKIKELIDDLVVRFKGTEQEKQLRQVQKKFKDLYNQNEDSKVSSKENAYKQTTSTNSDTKHSLSDSASENINSVEEYSDFSDEKSLFRTDWLQKNQKMVDEIVKNRNQVNTDNFKKWFNESKAKNQKGEPLLVYHGTDSRFTKFNSDGKAIWFGTNPMYANKYSKQTNAIDKVVPSGKVFGGSNERVIPSYIRAENPADFGNTDITFEEALSDVSNKLGISENELTNVWEQVGKPEELWQVVNSSEMVELLKKYGFDSIKAIEYGSPTWGIFESNQVKSAVANNGSFNNENSDIRYSLSDSEGRTLTKEQQEYFKDSKVRDDNGNLKVMYHGTENGGFTVFDPNTSKDTRSFFFSDEPSVASSYSGSENEIAPTGEVKTKGLYKTYLNLKNPYIVDARGSNWNSIVEFKKGDEFLSDIGNYVSILRRMDSQVDIDLFLESMNGDLVGSTQYAIDEIYIDEDTEESILKEDEQATLLQLAEKIDDAYNNWNEEEHLDEDGYETSFEDYVRNNYTTKRTREIAKEAYEKGYDGVIFKNLVDVGKFGNGVQAEYQTSTVAVAFDSNQIKSVENAKPTTDADIRYSLNKNGEQLSPYGNYNVYGKDIALEQAPVQEVAPVQEETVQQNNQAIDYAPLTEEQANERDAEQSITSMESEEFERVVQSYMDDAPAYMFDEDEIRAWAEEQARQNPQGATPKENTVIPESPLEERDIYTIGRERKTNAYMYENPEVKPFFQEEAQVMLWELQNSTKGERLRQGSRYGIDDYGIASDEGWYGTKRQTSEALAYLRDNFKYDKDDLTKGLKAIIEDHGAENNAVSKRIEFMLDERLREGYKDFMSNERMPANQDYINLLNDKQITEYNDEAFNNWVQTLKDEDIPPVQEDIAPIQQAEEMQMPTMTRPNDPDIIDVKDMPREDGLKERKWAKTSTESEPVGRKILPKDLDQNSITYEPISNKKTLNNANAMLDRDGYDDSVAYFNSQFKNKRISLDDIALGERLIQEAVKKGDMATAGELIQNVSILGTELGQKVQALSIIQRLTPEGQLKTLNKIVERGKAKGDKAFEGVEITQEMIDHILKTYGKDGTYNQEELDKAVEDVKKDIAKQMKVTKMDKVNAWRYLSMLGNPKTHIRNIVSNVGMKGTMAVKDAMARTIETILPIKNRTKTWKTASNDVKEFAKQTTKEMQSILEDGGKYSDTNDIKSKRQIFKNKVLNAVYEFNSDMLSKEDWWFQGSAFNKAFSEYLTANGINTKEDIENNAELVEKAKAYATEQSEIATFKQYSFIAHKLNEIESKNTATQVGVGAIVPFKKTPVNIAKAGLNYSPIGALKTLSYDALQVKKGNMEASQMIDNLSQGLTGTGLMLAGYMLAMSGFLNGAGKEDKEGKYDYQLGKQSYSVNIGGNTYSLSWLTPMAMPLFVGANAFETLTENKEWDGNVVIDALTQTLDPMSEMSVLSGLTNVLSSYESGSGIWADIGITAGQNYVTQFVPTLSSQIATVMDDKQRSTKVAGNSDFIPLEETVNKLKLKIPVLRQTLEPSTDVWGNEVKLNENKLQKAFDTFIAPYSRKENIATEIDEELKDLYSDTGDNGLFPQTPKNSVNYDGEKYNMSAKEYTSFKKTYGQNALDLMEELFRTTTYQNASSSDKADMVDKVYDYASDEAKREYLAKKDIEFTNATKDGEAYYKENTIKGAIENDMPLEEFDFYNNYPEKYEFLQSNNVSYEEYSKDKETREAYNWAFKNPERYTLSKSISKDLVKYKTYTADISKFRADTDRYGKTIRDSKKKKVLNYINGLDAEYGEKLILYKSIYYGDDTHNYEIIDYLNNRDDITFDEMNTILKELGFTVTADGTIYWN